MGKAGGNAGDDIGCPLNRPQEEVNIPFFCHVGAEVLSLVSIIPTQKLLVTLFPGRRKKVPHILWFFS